MGQIQITMNNGSPFSLWLVILPVYGLVQLGFLYRILKREDSDTPTRILWVLVVQFAPVGGMLLYLWMTPSAPVSSAAGRHLSTTSWAHRPGHARPS